jgi:hypothetical protein
VSGHVNFAELPPAVQFQLAILGPILLGAVSGFLLGESEAGWWISQALGLAGGFAGGLEHPAPRPAALRGLVAGSLFGFAIVAADAVSGDTALAQTPEPIGLIVILTALVGAGLGALGGFLRSRAV